jgi:zinc transport system permease protein
MTIDFPFILNLIVASVVGALAGYVGSLMILKRMALVGDALTHVALPGMGIALLWHINPFFGALASLFIGVMIIWFAETRTKLPIEALTGVVFAVSLAIGFLVTPEPEILEALFGDISKTTMFDAILAIALSVVLFMVTQKIYPKVMLSAVSEDLARSQGVRVALYNLLYLFVVVGIVALGVRVVGTLLMGALVVIPAAAAKNLSSSMSSYILQSLCIGALSAVLGIVAAAYFKVLPGPPVVLIAAAAFALSVFLKRQNPMR